MLWRKRKPFANALELSSCAAALVGPKIRRPRARKRSTTPAASGASGPTTVSWTRSRAAKSASSASSVIGTFSTPASRAVPPFPGATYTFWTRGLCASFHASACSRPPPPMTRSFIRARSMPEMTHAGEHHGEPLLVGGGDHLVVPHAAAGLDDRFRARLGHRVHAVAEREESIRGDDRSAEREPRVLGLDCRDARAVDAAHLAGADAERHAAAREDDRVRLDELRDAPGKQEIIELVRRRRAPRHDLELCGGDAADIRRLHEDSTADPLEVVALALAPRRHREHAH